MGKANIFVLDLPEGMLHEDDAAGRLARAAVGSGIRLSGPLEGKVSLIAQADGLLKIDVPALTRVNAVGQITFATLHTSQPVSAGQTVAGVRVVPLIIDAHTITAAEAICAKAAPLIQVKPFKARRVGVVTTGSEVYHGRIKDQFGPVLEKKFNALGSRVMRQILVSDDPQMTVEAIHTLIAEGADMVMVTGGMSVDPDDQTPASIRAAGARVISYGAPVFPGAMFMLATIGDVPVAGLPGCVMYYRTSIFDLVMPRLLAGETITAEDIAAMGHGGLCAGCADCRFPLCGFGKGVC
ncbi:molybdopterin-binding protein [Desulfosarcina cetonica]|uniref:molybdopterin-binding protein n=1 Tax=Desulfosarcina cetonica TaxID=90730 RepID=UPI000A3E79E6|nr:molybdopterin-binding protein [Desulfosarcina cetonica]